MLDHTYTEYIDHTTSWVFYALLAAEDVLIYGSDLTNVFGDTPPTKQGLHILPDRAFNE